ncbi:hypothetical protein OCHUTO_0413 [Orientia chuto str. Dubai]|uniref:Uncharacterized protein n=1 Tax=Orientia chuto str. Dubai TaxID=1359168 RepID=A0A0F3MLC7_9RICK|nr:hypothetical protein OCHUTO_0413 [Orientia chuto str. Dubai]
MLGEFRNIGLSSAFSLVSLRPWIFHCSLINKCNVNFQNQPLLGCLRAAILQ